MYLQQRAHPTLLVHPHGLCGHVHVQRQVQIVDGHAAVRVPGGERDSDMVEDVAPFGVVVENAAVVG